MNPNWNIDILVAVGDPAILVPKRAGFSLTQRAIGKTRIIGRLFAVFVVSAVVNCFFQVECNPPNIFNTNDYLRSTG